MVISESQIVEPRCAIHLLVPDWNICWNESSGSRRATEISVTTYERGLGFRLGSLSYKFYHGDSDHILTPTRKFDSNAAPMSTGFASEYARQFYRKHTHVFTLSVDDLPGGVVEVLHSDWRSVLPLRSQELRTIVPFDDEPSNISKGMAGPGSVPIYQYLRHLAVHSPLALMKVDANSFAIKGGANNEVRREALNDAIDLDRSAHLFISWSRMSHLESVFLDLRIYSHDLNTTRRCLSKSHVVDRAKEMGRYLRLRILVLAGLQSYSFGVSYEGRTVQAIEQMDQIDGDPNWIKIFRPAIREGGKIVLVDKLTD
ncbi:hypothetical protein F4777DRAFT_590411 [Nemania sp. FL0916]|nr:hypothetical protein F4777DRAFT_590411 [Nemania sp. FL0916]